MMMDTDKVKGKSFGVSARSGAGWPRIYTDGTDLGSGAKVKGWGDLTTESTERHRVKGKGELPRMGPNGHE